MILLDQYLIIIIAEKFCGRVSLPPEFWFVAVAAMFVAVVDVLA